MTKIIPKMICCDKPGASGGHSIKECYCSLDTVFNTRCGCCYVYPDVDEPMERCHFLRRYPGSKCHSSNHGKRGVLFGDN